MKTDLQINKTIRIYPKNLANQKCKETFANKKTMLIASSLETKTDMARKGRRLMQTKNCKKNVNNIFRIR